ARRRYDLRAVRVPKSAGAGDEHDGGAVAAVNLELRTENLERKGKGSKFSVLALHHSLLAAPHARAGAQHVQHGAVAVSAASLPRLLRRRIDRQKPRDAGPGGGDV